MNDIINASFEFVGAFAVLLSVRKAYQDKQVHGVSWLHVAFFTAWGFWNIYYYPSLDQWWSFAAGVFLVVVNCIWVGQLIYYSRPRPECHNCDTPVPPGCEGTFPDEHCPYYQRVKR